MPDADDALDAELDELLDHDRGGRTAHAAGLDGDRPPFVRPGVPEHPALPVALLDVLQERLGDVLRAQGIAREEARLRVVAGVGADVVRHGGGA